MDAERDVHRQYWNELKFRPCLACEPSLIIQLCRHCATWVSHHAARILADMRFQDNLLRLAYYLIG